MTESIGHGKCSLTRIIRHFCGASLASHHHSVFASLINTGGIRSVTENAVIATAFATRSLSGEFSRLKQYFRICLLGTLVALLGSTSACDSCSHKAKSTPEKSITTSHSAHLESEEKAAPVGVVEGVITLKQGTSIPAYPEEQMTQQVLRSRPTQTPEICTAANLSDRQPVKLTQETKLAGVLIAASKLKHAPMREAKIHDVVIEDCRLKPSFVAAQKGDKLRIRNLTDFPFMPQFGKSAFMETLLKGQEKVIDLDQGGLVGAVLCGYTASCGRTDVIVLYDAIHAVTDERGHFRIENYPAGQESLVNVWHPLFQETSTSVTLTPGETKTLEIELSPLEKYTVEESEPPANKPAKKSR